MRFQLPTETDMDIWLTNLPDEDLQYLSAVTDQVANDNVQDLKAVTHILALILHFCGKPALVIAEIMDLFPIFAMYLALEILRRQGDMAKKGKYSIVPGAEDGAEFEMTEQGKAKRKEE